MVLAPKTLTDPLNKISRDYGRARLDNETTFHLLKNQLRGHTSLAQIGPGCQPLSNIELLKIIADKEPECATLHVRVVHITNNEKNELRVGRHETQKPHSSDKTNDRSSRIEDRVEKIADRLAESSSAVLKKTEKDEGRKFRDAYESAGIVPTVESSGNVQQTVLRAHTET